MTASQDPYVRLEIEIGQGRSDILACLALEQGKTVVGVVADAWALYRGCSRLVSERPGGMFAYIVDDGYIGIGAGIPGEATEAERPSLEDD